MANTPTSATRPAAKKDAEATTPQKPKALFKVTEGAISAAVFENGATSVRRSYRTPDGKWETTSISFRNQESLVQAIRALAACDRYLDGEAPDQK